MRSNVLRDHIRAELYLDYNYPLYMVEEEQEKASRGLKRVNGVTYWDVQVRTIKILARLGIVYRMNERVEPMRVMAFFHKFWNSEAAANADARDVVLAAEEALADLVKMRLLGLEPNHNKTHYMP